MPSTAASSSSSLWPVLHLRHEADQPFIDLDLDSWLADRPCIDLVAVTAWLAAAQRETSEVEMGSRWRFDWRLKRLWVQGGDLRSVVVGLWVSKWVWWLKKCGLWLLGFDDFLVLNFLGLWLWDLTILLGFEKWGLWDIGFCFWTEFFGFSVCLFLKKISGFVGLFEGKNMKFMFWGMKKWIFLRKKRKKEKKSKTKN